MRSTLIIVSGVVMVALAGGFWMYSRPAPLSVTGTELMEATRANVAAAKQKYLGARVSFTGRLVNIKYDISTNAYQANVIMTPSFVNGVEKTNAMTLLFPPNDKRNFEAAKTSPTEITAHGIVSRISETETMIFVYVNVDPQ